MLPELFCLGPLCLQTVNLFLVLGFLVAGYIFFRKVREEHYLEMEAFDGFLLSMMVGLIVGRLAYVGVHFQQFGLSVWKWFDIATYPGVIGSVALVVAAVYLYRYSKKFTDDGFELLDIWSISVASGLAVVWLGLFFDGASMGIPAMLPWLGLKFPGQLEPHLPVQLLVAVYFLLLALYLQWVEYRYRTFSWYRSGKKSAQSGFLVAISLTASSLLWVFLSYLRPAQLVVGRLPLDTILGLIGVFAGVLLLYVRSGRKLGLGR